MSKKFHINKSGDVRQCRAKTKPCPLGGAESHFGTEDAAREAYEQTQAGSFSDPIPPRSKWVGGHYNGERDIVDGRPGRWSTMVTSGFGRTERATFFADDAGLQDDVKTLPNSFESEAWREVKREAVESGDLVGLEAAQTDYLRYENHEGEYEWSMGYLYDGEVSQYGDEMVRRALLGEESAYDYELYQRNFKQTPAREKFFLAMTKQSGINSQNVVDAAMVFPDRDLYPVLKRLNVTNVSVSALKNSRETGLVYTVMTPQGTTRSFSLYEHRNSDALCIGGQENWDVNEQPFGPYAKDAAGKGSKENVFAEFSHDTSKRQVAETLGYFLQQAQRGELESDQDLIAKAERLDWNAIIAERIPGFGEWVAERQAERLGKRSEEDSFAAWAREFE